MHTKINRFFQGLYTTISDQCGLFVAPDITVRNRTPNPIFCHTLQRMQVSDSSHSSQAKVKLKVKLTRLFAVRWLFPAGPVCCSNLPSCLTPSHRAATVYKVPQTKLLPQILHCVQKKTPTHIFFHISMNYLWV